MQLKFRFLLVFTIALSAMISLSPVGRATAENQAALPNVLPNKFVGTFRWVSKLPGPEQPGREFWRLDKSPSPVTLTIERAEVKDGIIRLSGKHVYKDSQVKVVGKINPQSGQLSLWEFEPVPNTNFTTEGSFEGTISKDFQTIEAEWTTTGGPMIGFKGDLHLQAESSQPPPAHPVELTPTAGEKQPADAKPPVVLVVDGVHSSGSGIPTAWVRETAIDQWRLQYFGHTDQRASDKSRDIDDPSGDGANNLQKFLTGADPHDSASFFHITEIAREGDGIRVTWMTGDGKTNALYRTTGDPSRGYAAIFSVTNTVAGITNYLDAGALTNSGAVYYRVHLIP
jgi:hypothetical protein